MKKAVPPPKPQPGSHERKRIAAAATRFLAIDTPVSVALERPDGVATLTSPHSDDVGWSARLITAFGSGSGSFADTQLAALEQATRRRGDERFGDLAALNAGLALVAAVAPQNEVEAALAVQMAGVHALASELLGKTRQTDRTDHIALYGGLAVKLTRTFTQQLEALTRLRSGGRQTVEVKHVHVNGNAVVGTVHAGGGGGRLTGNDDQPHTQALADRSRAPFPPLRSENADRDAMPVSSGEGSPTLPDARRGEGLGSPRR